MRVTLIDSGNPDKTATTTVTIPIIRNVNAPKFQQDSYEGTINENVDMGTSVIQVAATDADEVIVFVYSV